MFTENGVMVDLEELRKVVDECDVFTVGFQLFPERFIVDTRSTESELPMGTGNTPMGRCSRRSRARSADGTDPTTRAVISSPVGNFTRTRSAV